MSEEDYFKYYIQGSDHYLIPRDIFEELFNEMNNWKNEYKRREKKWEKWGTEKGILSSKMGEYLCKYQNIKREYANQNKFLCEYKKQNKELKEVIEEVRDKLYCWGEVLDAKFQQDLLQILDKVKDKETNKPISIGQVVSLEEAEYYFVRDNEELCGD